MTTDDWRLAADADDWQCNWESARRFQLRYFRSLPMIEKILAVEEMCRLARALGCTSIPPQAEDVGPDGKPDGGDGPTSR